MGVVQWLLLLLAIGGVVTFYVVAKRREGPNPWQDMQNPEVDGQSAVPPGPDSNYQTQESISAVDGSKEDIFTGLLGADDIPDLPDNHVVEAVSDDLADDLPDYEIRSEPRADLGNERPELNPAGLKTRSQPAEQRVIILHVACRNGQYFQGEEIHDALRASRLQFGMQDIYHRITEENGVPESVFSVANMLKPGFLNPDEAAGLETPGLTMFMVLPGPTQGVAAFKDMMETANDIAQALGGEVLDDKRVLLKRQTAQFLLDAIAEDERKQRLKAQHA